jgi:DNA modification methylase
MTHRILCGDCRKPEDVARLFAGAKANVVITSPPYASQRKYDESSGFKPIPPDQYVEWYRAVASSVESVLAPDGSYFLNIKEHAEDGERHLYVKDLTLAHKRAWGWRFVDEPNRFKNAWEPVFQFCRQKAIKFRPTSAGVESNDCLKYDAAMPTPSSVSGSGLLGVRPRGSSLDSKAPHFSSEVSRANLGKRAGAGMNGRFAGIARPSNVVEVRCECGQSDHSAPFPVALVEFFIKSFSDPGDIIFDPFMGSGTTLVAAAKLGRIGYGMELSPAYCDVIVKRLMQFDNSQARLEGDGRAFSEVSEARLTAAA